MGAITQKCCSKQRKQQYHTQARIKKIQKMQSTINPNTANLKNNRSLNSTKQSNELPLAEQPSKCTEETFDDVICSAQMKKGQRRVTFDDFQIKGKLGSGSYGAVFMVQLKQDSSYKNISDSSPQPSMKYAMKRIALNKLSNKRTQQNTRLQKFILSQLDNPFLTSLKFAFKDEQYIYLIMECAIGGAVDSFLSFKKAGAYKKYPRPIKFKKLGEQGIRFIATNVILGIQHLHSHNIMYRDLKPQNVVVFEDGYAKLTDFGLSKILQPHERTNSQAGTVVYFAPEVVSKMHYNKMIDFWSLGVFLYELSTSETPFKQTQILVRSKFKEYVLAASKDRDWKDTKLSEELKDIINKLLIFEPNERLGANGFDQIKSHVFFKDVDWQKIEAKQIKSPLLQIIQEHPTKVIDVKLKRYNTFTTNTEQQDQWNFNYTYSLAKEQ